MLKLAGGAVTVLVLVLLSGVFVVVVVPGVVPLVLVGSRGGPSPSPVAVTPSPSQEPGPSPRPSPSPVSRTADLNKLAADLTSIAAAGGVKASVSLGELGGKTPVALWSLNGNLAWPASSTYKLPVLMAEAQGIASGTLRGSDKLCYREADYEAGWFDDYAPGVCFTRNVLAQRVGLRSDNTAGHMLVRYLGGASAVNAFAQSMGATQSTFYVPNTTTSSDLALMWISEAYGVGGGATAQQWLYPLITGTSYERGIPAGTPKGPVVHKVGVRTLGLNDAALVVNGPQGAYVLAICSTAPDSVAGWQIVARLANRVWQFEASRPA